VPLYEYLCPRCGRFELIRKFSDAPLLTCPTCGGEIQKLASAPAIQFKGTGWYITDYARKSGSGTDGGKSKSGDGGSAASGGKDGSSSSTDTGSKSETASKATSSDSGSKGSSGGGSSTT
jgi:putative FmdB family regulatory protein